MASGRVEIDDQIPSVTKHVTQETIDRFESCGILDRQNIHNSPELARQRLGTAYPIASGRMSIAFAAESLRRFFRTRGLQPHRDRQPQVPAAGQGRRHHHRYRRGQQP